MAFVLAYHIYFTTYGTWLHGDERGSWDKQRRGMRKPDPVLNQHRADQLKHAPVTLTDPMRAAVDSTIREVCEHRNWQLLALNVRTNHVHAAVRSGIEADKVIHDFKASATRRLRAEGLVAKETRIWTAQGGVKAISHPDGVRDVINYILHGQ